MNGAGSRHGDFCNLPNMRTSGQYTRRHWTPQARPFQYRGCKLAPTTTVRTHAQTKYFNRILAAYPLIIDHDVQRRAVRAGPSPRRYPPTGFGTLDCR